MKKLAWGGFLILLLVSVAVYWQMGSQVEKQLRKAEESYKKGELAEQAETRERAFNRALSAYLALEKESSSAFGNGKVQYNIANSYFQLEQYPFAILYYNRALQLRPRDEKVSQNLAAAERKLGLASPKENSLAQKIFFFHHRYSLSERLQWFSLLAFLSFLLASGYLWFRSVWLYRAALVFLAGAALILLSIAYTHYREPAYAVVVRSGYLYRDAGTEYAKVREQPVPSGNRVEVLEVSENGQWIKIQTPDGSIGYVTYKALRII